MRPGITDMEVSKIVNSQKQALMGWLSGSGREGQKMQTLLSVQTSNNEFQGYDTQFGDSNE